MKGHIQMTSPCATKRVLVTLFESTDLLVLDAGDFTKSPYSLEKYADEDGYQKHQHSYAKTIMFCFFLHRIDRRDAPSTQLGSQWVVFDPNPMRN